MGGADNDAFVILRRLPSGLPAQQAMVYESIQALLHVGVLFQLADGLDDFVYPGLEVFVQLLVETFYVAGFCVADAADEFVLHFQDVRHDLVRFLFSFLRQAQADDDAFGKQFASNIIDCFLQVFSICHKSLLLK